MHLNNLKEQMEKLEISPHDSNIVIGFFEQAVKRDKNFTSEAEAENLEQEPFIDN